MHSEEFNKIISDIFERAVGVKMIQKESVNIGYINRLPIITLISTEQKGIHCHDLQLNVHELIVRLYHSSHKSCSITSSLISDVMRNVPLNNDKIITLKVESRISLLQTKKIWKCDINIVSNTV